MRALHFVGTRYIGWAARAQVVLCHRLLGLQVASAAVAWAFRFLVELGEFGATSEDEVSEMVSVNSWCRSW